MQIARDCSGCSVLILRTFIHVSPIRGESMKEGCELIEMVLGQSVKRRPGNNHEERDRCDRVKVKLTSKLGWSGGQYNVSDFTWSHTSRERCSMKRAIFFVTSAEFIVVSSFLLMQK